jgi:hypothetical protein
MPLEVISRHPGQVSPDQRVEMPVLVEMLDQQVPRRIRFSVSGTTVRLVETAAVLETTGAWAEMPVGPSFQRSTVESGI